MSDNFIKKHCRRLAGFTLVEMIVSVGIFAVAMIFVAGALLAVVAGNKEAQAIKSAIVNLDFALDDMVRTIKTGYDYDCNPVTAGVFEDCPIGEIGSNRFRFTDQDGQTVTYWNLNGVIHRQIGTTDVALTGGDVNMNRLVFYVGGNEVTAKDQPNVLIVLKGVVQTKKSQVPFEIQTMAVQRRLNK